jgi:3-methylcrotonyl-CoA carboxylase alpha subunit
MFGSLLIANRGEIALRVIRTARRLGIRTIAVYSDADAASWHVAEADAALRIGPSPAAESYLDIDAIVDAARRSGAEAVHPGYGFLSESDRFAEACAAAGLVFVGPPAAAIRAMGDKASAKALMAEAGVPLLPGYHGDEQDATFLAARAAEIGWPVLIKATSGGGGRGMRIVERADAFADALDSARREARAAFGDDRVLVEKYLARSRHIEVQIFADSHGNVVHLGERDCSLQRRHQKIVEEAPAPGLEAGRRAELGAAAVAAAQAIGYVGAGTVEFIVDASQDGANGPFHFMEMNTRLQVEHPVTEAITGYDLVEWQLRVAAGEALPVAQDEVALAGHAIEVRLYAEDPARGFMPSAGRIALFDLAASTGVRVDAGYRTRDAVATDYDAMLAKLIAHGPDRDTACDRLAQAVDALALVGPATNQSFLARVLRHGEFVAGRVDTGFIERHIAALLPDGGTPPAAVVAAAAHHVLGARRTAAQQRALASADPNSPWSSADGWRNNLSNDETLRFRCGEAEFEIGAFAAATDVALRCVADGADIVVLDGADQYRLSPVRPIAEAAAHEASPGTLTAPMPGKIVAVHVAAGDCVSRGQTLMVLEAMKMEHAIAAPADGVVTAVAFASGDQVGEGVELLRLDTEGD